MSGLLDRIALVQGSGDGAAVAKVAGVVLADPARAAELTIGALAERASTSPATVTRLCHRVGLSGYSELRRGLAAEAARAETSWQSELSNRIDADDSIERVLTVLAAADVRAIQETVGRLNVAALEQACQVLAAADRIDLYGVAGSAVVASEFQLRLHRIGRRTWAWSDVHSAITSAALLTEADAAIAFSDSGTTSETIEPLAAARDRGATTIAVTADPSSTLAATADIVLATSMSAVSGRPSAVAARHSQLLVLDCLYVGIAQHDYDQTSAALQATSAAIETHREICPETRLQPRRANRAGADR